MTDPLDIIEEGGVNFCLRAGLSISTTITGNAEVAPEGHYRLAKGAKKVHPLETALIGHEAKVDWKADATDVLGVTFDWLEGFIDGFAMVEEASESQEFIQGYLAALELRQRRGRDLGLERVHEERLDQ